MNCVRISHRLTLPLEILEVHRAGICLPLMRGKIGTGTRPDFTRHLATEIAPSFHTALEMSYPPNLTGSTTTCGNLFGTTTTSTMRLHDEDARNSARVSSR